MTALGRSPARRSAGDPAARAAVALASPAPGFALGGTHATDGAAGPSVHVELRHSQLAET